MTARQSESKHGDRISDLNNLPVPAFQKLYIPDDVLTYHTSTPEAAEFNATSGDFCYDIALRRAPSSRTSRSESATQDPKWEITRAELSTCFGIIKETSKSDYEASAWGWHPKRKLNEMLETDMRYLLVRRHEERGNPPAIDRADGAQKKKALSISEECGKAKSKDTRPKGPADDSHPSYQADSPQTPDTAQLDASDVASASTPTDEADCGGDPDAPPVLGFMSFMLTREEGQEVVYIYEIHLREAIRRQGLAAHLFEIVERIGTRTGMHKAMLTVFRRNSLALGYYSRRRYGTDECSPRPKRLRGGVVKDVDYVIMSKRLNDEVKLRRAKLL
ncbi:hypothetical protein MBLNU459_g6470t1 [Dothideomycetes sp. NU459]